MDVTYCEPDLCRIQNNIGYEQLQLYNVYQSPNNQHTPVTDILIKLSTYNVANKCRKNKQHSETKRERESIYHYTVPP